MDSSQHPTVVSATVLRIALRVGACCVYALVIAHIVWVFGCPSWSTPARVWDVCKTAAQSSLRCRFRRGRQERAPGRLLDALVRNRMDKYKLEQSLKFIKIAAHIVIVSSLVMVIFVEFGETDQRRSAALFVAILAWNMFLLLFAWEYVHLTVFRLNIMYAFVMCALAMYVILNSGDPEFFFNLGVRMTLRLLFAVVYLDYKKASLWNILFSMVTCWRFKYNQSVFNAPEDSHWSHFIACEVISCGVLGAALYYIEKSLEAHLRLQIVLEHQSKASLKLLGFQCDAVLWLTPDLRINGPAHQLSELLLLEAGNHHLDGREFQRYVADEDDRERFRNFIATSTAQQGTEVIPTVLHVSLRDATNTSISVDVFHVHCIDFQGREKHLLGICENAARQARQRRYDEPRQNEPHHQPEELPRRRAQPAGSSLPSVDENSSTSHVTFSQPIGATFNLDAHDPPTSDANVGELLLSRASAVLIKFDVFSTSFVMSECSLTYQEERAPGLMSLLPPDRIADVRRWAEANANCAVSGNWPDHVAREAGRLGLHLSSALSISAESTTIKFPRDFPHRGSRHAALRLRGITVNPIRDGSEEEPAAEDAPIPNIPSSFQNAPQEPGAAHDVQFSYDAQPEPVQILQASESQQQVAAAHDVQISDDAQKEPEPVQILQASESQQEHAAAQILAVQPEHPHAQIPHVSGDDLQEPADGQILQHSSALQYVQSTTQSMNISHLTRL